MPEMQELLKLVLAYFANPGILKKYLRNPGESIPVYDSGWKQEILCNWFIAFNWCNASSAFCKSKISPRLLAFRLWPLALILKVRSL